MRDSRVMNDFSEIEYGLNRLKKAYHGPIGGRLKRCLEGAASGITDEIVERFDGWSQRFTRCTYLACVSEHAPSEDLHGRLSMWRAYGGRTSVALVMNNRPFLSTSDVLKAYASPVLYADQDRFDREFERVTQGIEPLGAMLRMMGRETLRDRIFNVFLFAALCTKHPGFHEEQEWRVIHAAEMHPSKHLAKDLEVVRGAPQFVYKIPLKDIDDEEGGTGFSGAEVRDLLDRVIIGPSDDGHVVSDAFVHLLGQAGVPAPEERVFVSGIPLRN